MNDKKYKIAEYIDKELPADILEQLEVVGRVKHFLRPTSTSAISTAEDQPGTGTPGDGSSTGQTLREVQDDISKLIDDVVAFEADVEQLEELADEHLKNMSVPPLNKMVADAAKTLGSEDGSIDKDVLDRAITIMDFVPMLMSPGIDPVLAALTGDGTLSGPYLRCRDINSSVGKDIKLAARTVQTAELSIEDQGAKIEAAHEKKMAEMMIEILLTLWWKKLWPMFVVDMTIINPQRQIINPVDGFIGFFSKTRFTRKSADWIKSKGPLNKILNRIRNILMCLIPPVKFRPDNAEFNLNCSTADNDTCGKSTNKKSTEGKDNLSNKASLKDGMDTVMDDLGEDGPCIDLDELKQNMNHKDPEGFGCSPDCVKAAKVVLNAVLSDAFKPPQSQVDTYNQYKQGL